MIIYRNGPGKKTLSEFFHWTEIVFLILGFAVLTACNDKQFTIGDNFLESQTHLVEIDTLQVKLSTVELDSISTSATNVALIGSYKNAKGGNITCNSFFPIGAPGVNPFTTDFTYDSAVLELKCNGYSLGDTSQYMEISVHRTNEIIKTDYDGQLYSHTMVSYDTSAIGSKRFRPYPKAIKYVDIRLNYDIGNQIFNMLARRSDTMANENQFHSYFKDLALISNPNISSPILGFSATPNDVRLRVFAHHLSNNAVVGDTCDLYMSTTTTQFNQIFGEFPDTAIANHKDQRQAIPSKNTGNKTYIEGGVGLMSKINFTGIPHLLLNQNGVILKALLVIQPDESTYNWQPLPSKLILYTTNKINTFGTELLTPQGSARYPTFVNDPLYHENTSYTVDVTDFILSEASDNYFDPEHGLLITMPASTYLTRLDRLIISANPHKTYLKLYYLYYN